MSDHKDGAFTGHYSVLMNPVNGKITVRVDGHGDLLTLSLYEQGEASSRAELDYMIRERVGKELRARAAEAARHRRVMFPDNRHEARNFE